MIERFSYESREPMAITSIRTDVNPTLNPVAVFLTPVPSPATPSIAAAGWVSGQWRTAVHQADGLWSTDAWFTLAAHAYPRGTYEVFVWIDGTTYDPVRHAGRILIY